MQTTQKIPPSQADYLKKYLSGGGSSSSSDPTKKKKKKVPVKAKPAPKAFKIVDEDEQAIAQDVTVEEIVEKEDEVPIVAATEEKIVPEHAYIKKEDDGSGWVTVDDASHYSVGTIINHRTGPTIASPPRRRGGSPTNDSSPPRRARQDDDNSPPRRARRDDDNSPPRRSRQDDDNSPPRRARRDDDNSPPRRAKRNDDNSPPRRARRDEDNSPPRRARKDDSSPPRRGRSDDNSPPRKRKADDDNFKKPEDIHTIAIIINDVLFDQISIMSSGVTAGLHKGAVIRQQAEEKLRIEKERLSKLDPKDLGKDSETVYRDRRGKRLAGLEQFMRQQEGKFTDAEEDDMEWGKGKVQKQQKVDEKKRIEEEANKPFARTFDDPDLDSHFKDQDRWGDPMLGLVSKKSRKSSKPMYTGPAGPANRFNILPGYRWDGIDRSNGFEKEYFKAQSHKVAQKEEAYLWSVEDM